MTSGQMQGMRMMAEVVTTGRARQAHWLVGRTITAVRPMTRAELGDESWGGDSGRAIELDNGATIFSVQKEESNGPATLYGHKADGTPMYV